MTRTIDTQRPSEKMEEREIENEIRRKENEALRNKLRETQNDVHRLNYVTLILACIIFILTLTAMIAVLA